MRDVSGEIKISARTLFEADEILNRFEERGGRDESVWMRYPGGLKRPTRAAIIMAILLELDGQPREEQDARFKRGIKLLNKLIDGPPSNSKSSPKTVDRDKTPKRGTSTDDDKGKKGRRSG